MKILHTADWHIGQTFHHYDRTDEHRHFFDQLCAMLAEHTPDALVVAGDIYHNPTPDTAAQSLFVEAMIRLHEASPSTLIVVSAGNHDSGARLDTHRLLWQKIGIKIIGSVQRRDDRTFDPEQFISRIPGIGTVVATPFINTLSYPATDTDDDRSAARDKFYTTLLNAALADETYAKLPIVLSTHAGVIGASLNGHDDDTVGGLLSDDPSLFGNGYDYIALGHIHSPQTLDGGKSRYSGSPLPISFSETFEHSVSLVEIDHRGSMPKVTPLPLTLLHDIVTIGNPGDNADCCIEQLAMLHQADTRYVRVMVDQEGPLPADINDRAQKALNGKSARFCEARKRRPLLSSDKLDDGKFVPVDFDDIKRLDPLTLATEHYLSVNGEPLGKDLLDMLNSVISNIDPDL